MTDTSSLSGFPRLFVLLPESADPAQPLDWFAPDAYQHGAAPLDTLPAAARLIVLLAPPRLTTHNLDLPRRPQHKLLPLLRHALEDRLLGGSENLHLSVQQARDGQTRVHGCDRDWLRGWLRAFAQAGRHIHAAHALPDYLDQSDEWRWLPLQHGRGLLLSPSGDSTLLDDQAIAAALLPDGANLHMLHGNDVLAQAATPIPLLHGEFARRNPALQLDWRPLRRVGVMLAVLLLVLYVTELSAWWHLRSATKALQQEMRQSFAAAFPGEPVIDPSLQVASKLRAAGLGGSSGQRLSDWLQRVETALGAQAELARLTFSNDTLQLTVPEKAAPQAKASLTTAGFTTEQSSASAGQVVLTLSEKAR